MNNIFENAYFGKHFRTRNKEIAIYSHEDSGAHCLLLQGGHLLWYKNDGKYCFGDDLDLDDIVSEWQEEINEEKLDELAEKFCDEEYENPTDVNKAQNGLELGYANLLNCFKAGYRKAKE